MKPTLQDLTDLARSAGEILRAGLNQANHLEHKGEINIVTEVDKRSEDYILSEINAKFPGHHIIAEESGETAGDAAHTWYIDPLDGTTNFAHGLPIFSVSIAYAEAGEVILGVVYDPMRDELFTAEKGKGAAVNGTPLKVGTQEELSHCILVTGFPYDRFTNPVNNLDNFNRFALKAQGVRRLGSAALDLCYVAAGRVDGYWELRLYPWDMAAGLLIVQEAGGLITKFNGDTDILTPPHSIVAANPVLHAKMMHILAQQAS